MTFRSQLHRYIRNVWYASNTAPPWWRRILSHLTQYVVDHRPAVNPQPYRAPLITVGNLTVGGSGKTPFVAALVLHLQNAGWNPGVICRGDGGQGNTHPQHVQPEQNSLMLGDEARMHSALGVPVWQGRKRHEVALALLAHHPEVNIVISDDGLQHMALHRDIELLLLNADYGIGNGWLLPAGPLREPIERLNHVDAIILYRTSKHSSTTLSGVPGLTKLSSLPTSPNFCTTLRIDVPHPLHLTSVIPECLQPLPHATWDKWASASHHMLRIAAVTGIAHPENFFIALQEHGIHLHSTHAFPDHHTFSVNDFPGDADIILLTEKDAVKCRAFDQASLWVIPSHLLLPHDLTALLDQRLSELLTAL